MATSTYGTPYVQGSDLVSAYPTVSSSLATRVDEVSYRGNGLNAQTGTTYTLVAGDAGKTITLSNASPVAVTLPQDSTADLPDGAVVTFYNLGAGTVTISQGTGATLQGGSITLAQYAVTSVIKLSANTYGKFDGGGTAGLTAATPTSIANSGGTATLSSNTVTFTTVNSVSLNSCFTSTFRDYRCQISITAGSVNSIGVRIRMRASGTDNTSAEYNNNSVGITSGNAASNIAEDASTYWTIGTVGTGSPVVGGIDAAFLNPQVASTTNFLGARANWPGTAANSGGALSAHHFGQTAFDGFSIIASTGTISGTVSVFGYQK